jgi:hypothetical protein
LKHDPVEVVRVPRANESVEHGLALGITAILQMLDFDEGRGIGVGVDHVVLDALRARA